MQLATIPQNLTMTSREIAALLEKQHGNIKISAERLSEKGVIGTLAARQFTHNGNTYTEYLLNKRDSIVLVAQNCLAKIGEILDAFGKADSDLQEILNALASFDVPEDCADMYVYAIRNTTTGNIKLGISRNPEARLRQLQTGNDCLLELVAYMPALNGFKDESAIHIEHADKHIRGEWFNKSAALAISN